MDKKAIIYKMWGRPTILWKLECDLTKPRRDIFNSMLLARFIDPAATENNEVIRKIAKWVLVWVGIACAAVVFQTSFAFEKWKSRVCFSWILVILHLVSSASLFGIRSLAVTGRDNIEGKVNSLRSMA